MLSRSGERALNQVFITVQLKTLPGGLSKRSNKGLCRGYAPQASALTAAWMETKNSAWDGDHERIPQELEDTKT